MIVLKKLLLAILVFLNFNVIWGSQIDIYNTTNRWADIRLNRAGGYDRTYYGLAPGKHWVYRYKKLKGADKEAKDSKLVEAAASISVNLYSNYDKSKAGKYLKSENESGGKGRSITYDYKKGIRTRYWKWADVIIKEGFGQDGKAGAWIKVVQGEDGY